MASWWRFCRSRRWSPPQLMKHNFHCDIAWLRLEDEEFERLSKPVFAARRRTTRRKIVEIRRVRRRGVLLGSVTTDLSIDLIERFNLLEDVRLLCSRWDWSEKFHAAGFVHALFDPGAPSAKPGREPRPRGRGRANGTKTRKVFFNASTHGVEARPADPGEAQAEESLADDLELVVIGSSRLCSAYRRRQIRRNHWTS